MISHNFLFFHIFCNIYLNELKKISGYALLCFTVMVTNLDCRSIIEDLA